MTGFRPAVSGKTKSHRPIVQAPLPTAPPSGQYTDPNGVLRNPDGSRAVSGKTKAARGTAAAAANAGNTPAPTPGTTTDSNGVSYNADGSRVVSGATKARRATTELIASVEKYFLLGALVVGSIYIIRHFHLLSGGASSSGGGGGGGGERIRYVRVREAHSGKFQRGG